LERIREEVIQEVPFQGFMVGLHTVLLEGLMAIKVPAKRNIALHYSTSP
jgi:hypothetical protein